MSKKWQTFKTSIKQLSPFISPYKWGFFTAMFMVIVTCFALSVSPMVEGMMTSLLMKNAMDIANKVEGAGVEFDKVMQIMMVLLGLYLLKTASQSVTTITLTNSIQNAMHDLRNALQDKIRKLPVSYFDTHQYGDILSRITNDVDTLSNALQQTLTEMIRGTLMLILAIIMMFNINVFMTFVVLLIIPAALFITKVIVKRSQRKFQAQQDALGKLNGAITEMYTGYNEILLFNKQQQSIDKFKDINENLCQNAFQAQFMSSIISPCISLVTYIIIGTIGFLGSLFAMQGKLLIGELQAFVRYIWQVNDPISQVSNLSSQIQSAFAAAHRIFEVLNEDEEPLIENVQVLDHVEGHVELEHICFGYHDEEVLHDIDVDIKSGQMVAVVGPTGSGKTTLISLLMRFYDTTSGSIKIDGVDIRNMPREQLRSIFGMVLQDTWLFHGSIYDNIRYGRLDARKDEVIAAARQANVDHFIRTLPDGYDMIVNEEANNISQGEKQLLTIARAILKNPPIMILDEATSSVDTRLEKMLQEAMHNVMQGRTSFVIAHRLSTIRNADLILVIKDGHLIEKGTHDELIHQDGFYKQLYNAQFQDM
ncbi:MAG: ABC transporter ATP-binding protein [Longibaculum muris]|uniref:ATP-binding cassette subfamily B multidrug efflux pump n=1 Tax=Longibaculum muris TaxID=1796628 RepID=A0A4V2W5T2_9FIRM|nr:ABC transporter ATP-binding protein [Longibaculum muris]KXU45293.1 ABC transporter, ATP-binding protein [Candidatus Stoquefichus sp. KLE1796]MCR1886500.1 ABC transporter ATP-binding protein/permease [Longibaculum muris]MED9812662.1 ABC transporter ATP-binding protein [Longibaculum muris]TCW01552.1 ATP-binding cassette subfamily B multidrug efflux pump [Longibaculum muris]